MSIRELITGVLIDLQSLYSGGKTTRSQGHKTNLFKCNLAMS